MSVVEAVTSVLETYLSAQNLQHSVNTIFHTAKPPNISIKQYLKRLEQYMKCSIEAYIIALIYLDRLTTRNKEIVLNIYCIHRLFLVSLVVALKFFDDKYYKNAYYSKVGGIPNAELNELEVSFLVCLDFNLFVSTEEYENYYNSLMQYFGVSA
jgi:Cyclin